MNTGSNRPALDDGERLLRRIARVGAVLALCWAAGGVYLVAVLDARGVLAWLIGVVAAAPLYLLWTFAGEALGAVALRRWMNALRFRIPPVLERRVGGPILLLFAIAVAIALACLVV